MKGWGGSYRGGVGWVMKGWGWGGWVMKEGGVGGWVMKGWGWGWGGSKLKLKKIITHRVLKIHKWISGDVYEWGSISSHDK